MGTQFLNVDVGRLSTNLTNKLKSTMFRFVALFALVAVAFAEPEADSQFVYSNVAGVPVVNGVYNTYAGHVVAPMTKEGVPEKTDSVKIAEKQHELAKEFEKVTKVQYVAPYTTYAHAGFPYTTAVAGYPYTTGYTYNTPVVHHLGKRDADSDAALYYKTYGYNYGSPYTYSYGTPYTYNAFPYRNVYGWY